jgi:beta-glucanase (GH16 family)
MGVHPFGDPTIVDDFAAPRFAIDVTQPHTYGLRWEPTRVAFYLDGELVRVVDQSPQYPMQLMLGLYGFAPPQTTPPQAPAQGRYPLRLGVQRLRGYRRATPTD